MVDSAKNMRAVTGAMWGVRDDGLRSLIRRGAFRCVMSGLDLREAASTNTSQ